MGNVPRTARGQRTRQALLDAAEQVFGEAGFHGAGIVEITQRAGVALGTFYLYFPDKHAIFVDLVHTLNETLRFSIRSRIGKVEGRIEQEIAGAEAFFAFVRAHRNLYLVIREAESVDEDLYRWHYRTLAKPYVRGIRRAQLVGEVRADLDAETLAYMLMGIAESMGMRYVLWDSTVPSGAARRTFRTIIRSALAPEQGLPPAMRKARPTAQGARVPAVRKARR